MSGSSFWFRSNLVAAVAIVVVVVMVVVFMAVEAVFDVSTIA